MASSLVNAHITRALALGAEAIDETWLGTATEWLGDEGLTANLQHWANPAFGTNKDGSSIVSKVRCLGTTINPRGRDFTTSTSATTYSATGLNGLPAILNANSNSWGYFGGGQFNPIRRKTGLTMFACYKKPTAHTNTVTLLGFGQNGGVALQHLSGNPGTINAFAGGFSNAWSANATHATTLANADEHIIGLTVSDSEVIAYVEGVGGTPEVCTNGIELFGVRAAQNSNFFISVGTKTAANNAAQTAITGTTTFDSTQALFTWSDLLVFDVVLSPAKMASLNSLLRTRYGP